MGVLDLQARQHRLIHRAHRNGGGEKTRRMLGRPPRRHASRPVLPKELPSGKAVPRGFSRRQHPWNGKDCLGRAVSEYALHCLVDAPMELPRRGSGRNGEVEPFDTAGGKELREAPECGLRLTRACFGLEDHELLIASDLAHYSLRGIRLRVTGQLDERRRGIT